MLENSVKLDRIIYNEYINIIYLAKVWLLIFTS